MHSRTNSKHANISKHKKNQQNKCFPVSIKTFCPILHSIGSEKAFHGKILAKI